MQKVFYNTYKQYIRSVIHHKYTSDMHNLKTNFNKFFNITKSVFKDRLNHSGDFIFYQNKPKLSDCEIIALAVTGGSLGIHSESYYWGNLKFDYKDDLPGLIHRNNFNRRRKHLYPFIEQFYQHMAAKLNECEDVYLVDYISVPLCKIAREKQSKICKEDFETSSDKGYSAVNKSYYYGYKLHLVTSVRGEFHSMDITKASVYDVHY
jgi:hypothetical protein